MIFDLLDILDLIMVLSAMMAFGIVFISLGLTLINVAMTFKEKYIDFLDAIQCVGVDLKKRKEEYVKRKEREDWNK